MLYNNHRHSRVCVYLHYSLPSEPRRCALCSFISKIKDAVCELEDELPQLFVLFSLLMDLLIPLWSQSLTNYIFKFWSNTTLKAGAASLYSLMDKQTVLVPQNVSTHRLKWKHHRCFCYFQTLVCRHLSVRVFVYERLFSAKYCQETILYVVIWVVWWVEKQYMKTWWYFY